MPTPTALAALVAALALVAAILFWLLVMTEGAYLGPRAVRWLYDRGAPTYDAVKDFDRAEEAASLGVPLFERLHASAGPAARVLDVATGTGRLPRALFEVPFFEGTIVALDSSPRMLAEAADKLAPHAGRLELREHPAAPLPFPDAAFDAVTLLEALEFLPDRAAALSEAVRVLRPGGWLVVTNRIGLDARLMPGRVDRPAAFEARLRALGLVEVETRAWMTYYDLVWARRPAGGVLGSFDGSGG